MIRWAILVVAIGWCALIAGTSSTVILPHDFFAWIASHLFKDDANFRRFVTFWGFSWFAIVKGWHVAEFAILFVVMRAILNRWTRVVEPRNLLITAVFCLFFALSDEYHQTFVPGRGGRWSDVAIDGFGIGIAMTVAWRRRFKRGDTI